MTSCICGGEGWPDTAFVPPSAIHMHVPVCADATKSPLGFISRPQERQEIKLEVHPRRLKRKSGLRSPGQPEHTRTHTLGSGMESLQGKSHETVRPHSMSTCQLAMLWQPAWPHCLPPPQPCGLSPRTVLGTVPWRPWLLLGGFGKRWNEEEYEIALSARS